MKVESVLQQAAQLYQTSSHAFRPLTGGNFSQVFGFTRQEKEFILRITPPDEGLDEVVMQASLAWVNYLVENGASVAKPVPSTQGHLIEPLLQDGETVLVAVFEKAQGILGEKLPFDAWDSMLIEELGRVTGQMHAVSRTYNPAPGLRSADWDQAPNCYNPSEELDPSQKLVRKARDQIWEIMRSFPREPGGYGMIHGDLHQANLFVEPQQKMITIFDFDDCCYGWYAMDIAMTLFDILVLYPGSDPSAFAKDFMQHYLHGYMRANSLDPSWIQSLPEFLKLLEIGLYTSVYPLEAESPPQSWVGHFMKGRRTRIENGLAYVEFDFEKLIPK
jgi:Ser/Thr protein kinase RdoA (MazF antagonist)